MPRTLYLSDLDGTLLTSDKRITRFTERTINDFVARGGLFTYATARSIVSAGQLTERLDLRLPVITYNGTFIMPPEGGAPLWSCAMQPWDAARALEAIVRHGLFPAVYSMQEGRERMTWLPAACSEGLERYTQGRTGDARNRPVRDPSHLLDGEVFYMLLIEPRAVCEAIGRELMENPALCVHMLEDTYNLGEWWLEIMPAGAGKDRALVRLRQMLGVERVIAFGDNLNDLAMFRKSDEAYAVEGAKRELIAEATAVIGSNDADGVARFMRAL